MNASKPFYYRLSVNRTTQIFEHAKARIEQGDPVSKVNEETIKDIAEATPDSLISKDIEEAKLAFSSGPIFVPQLERSLLALKRLETAIQERITAISNRQV